jgi:trk system potassium uptake protein TrkH
MVKPLAGVMASNDIAAKSSAKQALFDLVAKATAPEASKKDRKEVVGSLKGGIKSIFKDEEFRLYGSIVVASIIIIAFNINGTFFKSFWQSLRYSAFQVSSIITTTGYSTTDFNLWPIFSRMILLLLMFIGGCAGSTAGAIKNVRILLLFRIMKKDLMRIIHPRAVYTVRFNGKAVNEKTLSEILTYFFMYMFIFVVEVLVVSLDGFDMATTISSVAATLGNIGPGLGVVGPMGNFADLSILSKLVLSMGMIIGRIEIYPILLLLIPTFWRKANV